MKFEKFFKSAGTHGQIVKKSDKETWLLCGGVGMKIPNGVNNLGVSVEPTEVLLSIINSVPDDDVLTLERAVILDPAGKASDIIRVFETDMGDQVSIYNAEYGLLEKKDYLTYLEIEVDGENENGDFMVEKFKFMVIRDHSGDAIGYISDCGKAI